MASRLPHPVVAIACLVLAGYVLLAVGRPTVSLSGRTTDGARISVAVHGGTVKIRSVEREPVTCASGYRTTVTVTGGGATVRYPDGELASVTAVGLTHAATSADGATGSVHVALRLYRPGQAPDTCEGSDRFRLEA